MKKIKYIFSICLVVLGFLASAQEIPDPMDPPCLVNDFAQLLNQNDRLQLEKKLRDYHDTTTTQIYVVIVDDLLGYDIADYTFRLGEKWGVGQKGKNNGVVILVKTKRGNQKGEIFIATGYGLEDVIPDAIANRIMEKEIVPHFMKDDFYSGLNSATSAIIDLASGKFTAEQYAQDGGAIGGIIALIIFIIIFSIIFNVNKTKGKSIGHNIPFWVAMGMLSGSGGGRSGGFGSFSSGSGSFGGFSGGGGGSFGGGGARGSW